MKDSCVEMVNTGIAFGKAVSVRVQWFKPDETSETDGLCHLCECKTHLDKPVDRKSTI